MVSGAKTNDSPSRIMLPLLLADIISIFMLPISDIAANISYALGILIMPVIKSPCFAEEI